MSNLDQFIMFDPSKSPVIYQQEWNIFTQKLDATLNEEKKNLLEKFKINNVYFMKYRHGLKLSDELKCPNFITTMTTSMGIKLLSNEGVILQVHIANTINGGPDTAMLVNYEAAKKLSDEKTKVNLLRYEKFFLSEYGHLTLTYVHIRF